jgi:dTDP-4-amino-4,6-dideoxygalactose transaminase
MTPLFKVWMSKRVDRELREVLHSGFIGQGPKVEAFEKALVPWIGRRTILTTNSCTSALALALRLSEVKSGDEVISTPVTCTATNVPVLGAGAKIVWADVNPWTGNIDPESVKKKITKRTKAVIAVHWGGLPCDLASLQILCREYGLKLIEDAAHGLGAVYRRDPIGSHGDFVCFSFQAIKHLTTGDGGLLSCKSKKDYDRAKLLRWYGIKRPADLTQDVPEWGYKFHMNDLAATIGLANLQDLCWILRRHRENAAYYAERLPSRIYSPDSASWLQTLHVDDKPAYFKRMAKAGIQTGHVHERNDRYSMFKASRCPLPGVDAFYKTQVNIPVGWWVTKKDREAIVRAVHG